MAFLYSAFFLAFLILTQGRCAASINIAISSAPNNLSPFFSTDANSQNLNRLIHSSLIDFDELMTPKCIVCESYQETFGDFGYIIKFKIKKNLKFWDGTPVTANSIKESIKLFTDEVNIKSVFRFSFQNIKKINIINEFELELHYEKFSLEHLSNLVLLKILKLGAKKETFDLDNIIGLGKYQVSKLEPFLIILNPAFDKNLPALNFKVVKDETTLALKIIRGEIDLSLANLSPRKAKWIADQAESDVVLLDKISTNYIYIGINHNHKILKEPKVRKALSHLIPRQELIKYKLMNKAEESTGLISKAFHDYYVEIDADRFDLELGNKLLDEAGHKKNKNGQRFTLDWKVNNNKASLELVQMMKGELEKSGIKINLNMQEWGTFMKSIKDGSFDIFMGQWIGFTGPDILNFVFHSQNIPPKGANRGHYKNEDVDLLLALAEKEEDKKKRSEYYINAQKLIAKDYPYINLWHPYVSWIAKKCIKNITVYANGSYLGIENLAISCEKK